MALSELSQQIAIPIELKLVEKPQPQSLSWRESRILELETELIKASDPIDEEIIKTALRWLRHEPLSK